MLLSANSLAKHFCYSVMVFVALIATTSAEASTGTFVPLNLTLDSNAEMYGGSNARVTSGKLLLNWNRPAVDASHVGYWRLDDGTGTATADDSSLNNDGSFSTNPTWALASSDAFAGSNAANFAAGRKVTAGEVLDYERTQAWTVMTAIRATSKPVGATSIIFSNVNATPYPGYELFINTDGFLHVRIMNAYGSNYIGKIGTTDVCDGQWHTVAASYDGTSTAAGVTIYLDGVAQATTVESDTLSASIIGDDDDFVIGNQTGFESTFYFRGAIDEFSLSNVVRSPSYIAQYSTATSLPPVDANTVLYYHFDDLVGTTAIDSSASNYSGTLTSTEMLTPATWMGTAALSFSADPTAGVIIPHNDAYNLGAAFTISSWARGLSAPALGTLFYKLNGSLHGFILHAGFANKIQWWDSTAQAFRDTGDAGTLGWHNYTVRLSGGELDIFVDGVLIGHFTGVSSPTAAAATSLLIGRWETGGQTDWLGSVSLSTIANVARSDAYIMQFAKRFPASGIASLANVGSPAVNGGGDLGGSANITGLSATFIKPPTTNIQFRLGAGASAAAATADKEGESYATLEATNVLDKTGRYVDYDLKMLSSTDSFAQSSPELTSLTVTYERDNTSAASSTGDGGPSTWLLNLRRANNLTLGGHQQTGGNTGGTSSDSGITSVTPHYAPPAQAMTDVQERSQKTEDSPILDPQRIPAIREALIARFNEQMSGGDRRDAELEEEVDEQVTVRGTSLSRIAQRRGRLSAIVDGEEVLYRDVDIDAWYAPYVSLLIEENVAEGYKDADGKPTGIFGTASPVTREEVLKMALEAAQIDLTGAGSPRNRTAHGRWSAAYVAVAETLQLSVFRPSVDVQVSATRGEVIQTILEVMGVPLSTKVRPPYRDVPIDHPNALAIDAATYLGIVEGDRDIHDNPTNAFRPDDSINRAEAAKLIALMQELMLR